MSINQYTMNSLLLNQKVKKRKQRRPKIRNAPACASSQRNSFHKGPKKAFRPKGIISLFEKNIRFIEGVRQKPDRFHCHKQEDFRPSYRPTSPVAGEETDNAESGRKRLPSFSVPALPIAALLLLALGFVSILYSQGALDWIYSEAVNTAMDSSLRTEESQYNLALYAGVNPLDVQSALPFENASVEDSGDSIPLDMTETFAWQSYKVKKGDSVSKIAVAFSVSMDAIIASNGISNARSLREGETLRIPNMDGIPYVVKSGDSLSKISKSMGVPLEAILDANDIQSDAINAGTTLFIPGARMNKDDLALALGEIFIYPLKGSRLSSPFGWRNDPISGERRHHAAIDLAAPQGTVVWAAMDGKVSALGYNATYGNYIILSHAGGFQTMYAHLHSISVKKGDTVSQGKQIGTVGNTGYSTGSHLHFAVYKNSTAVNPLDYLSTRR
jgi:murein DD-endopeptidase MepM/ murein hydrolase activator NlpD